ncbi:sphingomyelin phosphodiesterase 2 [Esox lucius]|uniref:sphingomyelin phosphodiesterase n=1 Tax=Esox lucius TaxID=8010 RepID=A0A3P9AID4_ESOLU|nr:sphingomyelin phosphodiesterase 2 [Esox lucius]XP_010897553.1 sphingomyelin phosphodiesterase 2 [Esox lucius]
MADHDTIRLRVFSLNCWGIRYLSKHRLERYAMIGELLSREQHDIVLLQEVWSENDFLGLKRKLSSSHPHSHYFKSGVIGSGLATFSRHRIHDAFLYRYSLNGYPYMAHHGDWFGGKAVGVVILKIGRLTAHVYVTHLHAEYCRDKDSYLPHRVVQAWELQHFIRHTSSGADLVILGGDLNMHPQDLGTRLLRTYTGLLDGYTETAKFDGCEGGITLIADNPFINPKELCPFENGVRIDYILYKGSGRVSLRCVSLATTKGSVPGHPFPYSDHEALSAELELHTTTQQAGGDQTREELDCASAKLAELVDMVTEARTEVKVGLHCAERMRYTAARTGVMGLALLLLELAIGAVPWLALGADQPFPRTSFYLLGALCFAILLIAFLFYVFYTMELKSLQGAEDQMRLAVGSLQERLKGFPQTHPLNSLCRPLDEQDTCPLTPEE